MLRCSRYRLPRFFLFFFAISASLVYADTYKIDVYTAYGTPRTFVVDGRILKARTNARANPEDGKFSNLKRNLKQFFNEAGDNRPITLSLQNTDWSTTTDPHGYYRIEGSTPQGTPLGWQALTLRSEALQSTARLLIIPPENTVGLISDIDDTIMVSQVLSKRKLLKNTFFKNPTQRLAVPHMAKLYQTVMQRNPDPLNAPLFYLSASPKQLSQNLKDFLSLNHFPQGVLITKRVSRDGEGDPLLDQKAYKISKIEEILKRLPDVRFILVGDNGEKDPEIYSEIQERYPTRIEAIWIRKVNLNRKDPLPPHQKDLEDILRIHGEKS